MKYRSSLCSVLLLILAAATAIAVSPARAQAVRDVQVNNFRALPQERSNWCWAASIQAIFLTKGLQIDQQTIVTAAYGAPENRTAPGFEGTLALLNTLVVDIAGNRWSVKGGAGATYPAAPWLLAKLSANEPVMIWYRDEYSNHSIIVNGGRYSIDAYGNFAGWRAITAFDPYLNRNMVISAENIPRYVYGTFDVAVRPQ